VLVLSRRPDESICIDGGRIQVMVVEVRGNGSVRLGIRAPAGIDIHRQEVFEAIKKQGGPLSLSKSPRWLDVPNGRGLWLMHSLDWSELLKIETDEDARLYSAAEGVRFYGPVPSDRG